MQLAVAKAQFEIIHPFFDGNARIGRMLIPLFLFAKELLSSPIFYLSAYLERNREVYYQGLQAVSQDSDWNGWIVSFLFAVLKQAKANYQKTRKILELYDRMKQIVPTFIRSQYTIQAIDWPVFQTTDFIRRSGIPKDSARRILEVLGKNGIIRELRSGKGRRASILMFPELISITEELD